MTRTIAFAMILVGASHATPTPKTVGELASAYRSQHEQAIVDEFAGLLALSNYGGDLAAINRNAEHIVSMLESYGIDGEILRLNGAPPVVFAEVKSPGATSTVMVYVHYDGQPVQAENWASDPFVPVLRDDMVENGGEVVPMTSPFDPDHRLFARSAGDDKAPVVALIHALEALKAVGIEPTVNLKFFFEGEEEIGSPHLRQYLSTFADRLGADLWLFCDGPRHQTGRPQLAYGVRGATGFEVTVYGPGRPLHSGHYGNWAPNPIAMLTDLMTTMRDAEGHVKIEGFYDEVREPSAAELAAIEAIPRVDLALKGALGLGRTEGGGERLERAILRPALNFRGIAAGGVGEQSRNIIVPEATASFGLRLVPDQTIDHLQSVIERHITDQGYHIVRAAPSADLRGEHQRIARVRWAQNGYRSLRTSFDHPIASKIAGLLKEWAGGELVQLPTMGGSLPLYLIEDVLGAPVVILPVANHDNNQHGENENMRIGNLWDAIEMYAVVFALLE